MSKNAKTAAATKVERKIFLLPNVRISYPALFKARAMENDQGEAKEPEYSADFILDKNEHAKVLAKIEAEVKRIAIETWGKVPQKFRGPIVDAENIKDDDDNYKDGYDEDKVRIRARSRNRPPVVNRDKSLADEDVVYGGCYVNAAISLWPWKHKASGYGVSCNLGSVQFVKNGERFGGALVDPDEVFEDLGEDDEGEDEAPKKGKKKSRPADDDDDDPTAGL